MAQNKVADDAQNKVADDLLSGTAQIAAEIGWSQRQTFYACERGHIPAFKIGKKWCALKSALRGHFLKLNEGGKAQKVA